MKTKNLIPIAICLMALSACNKELNTPRPPGTNTETSPLGNQGPVALNEFNVSMNHNLLSFKTVSDFVNLVNDNTLEKDQRFQEVISGYSSYVSHNALAKSENKLKEDPFKDALFGTILNSNDAVEIGDHIYKVDMAKEKVFSLPSSHADQYPELLSENTSNANIKVYSVNEDVLEIEHSGMKPENKWWIFCNDPSAPNKTLGTSLPNGDAVTAWHLTAGIYFSLEANIVTGSVNVYRFDTDYLYYKVRCGSSAGPMQDRNEAGHYDFVAACQKWNVYRNVTNFSSYHFHVRGRDNSTNPASYSPWILLNY